MEGWKNTLQMGKPGQCPLSTISRSGMGPPLHDDRALFELLVLEGMQAGVSWRIILDKREAFRQAFDRFQPEIVASYGPEKLEELIARIVMELLGGG